MTVGFCMCVSETYVKCEGLLMLMEGKVVLIEALPELPVIIIVAI